MGRGHTVLSGVAWSGRGTIPRVDVTIDGGKNWMQARMSGPSFDKSMHRFYYEFDWDGIAACCCKAGRMIQPATCSPPRTQLREVRGENSIYHNNAIQTWAVNEKGDAENVEIS